MDKGWIKLHRKLLDNPIFKNPYYRAVWIELLLLARYEPYDTLFAGKRITLMPGQLTVGTHQIANETGVSRGTVYRILERLKSEQQIEQQTSNKCSLITIVKWKEYQQDEQQIEQQMSNRRATDEQQMSTSKESKKVRKIKMEETNTPTASVETKENEINRIFSVFYDTINKNINFGQRSWRAATAKLIEDHGFDVVLKLTQYACSIQGQEFAPMITNPYQLREKLASLQIFIKKSQAPKKGTIQSL